MRRRNRSLRFRSRGHRRSGGHPDQRLKRGLERVGQRFLQSEGGSTVRPKEVVGSWRIFTVFLVQFVNDLRPVALSSEPTQPSVRILCEPRSGNGPDSSRVDHIRHQMNRQNNQRNYEEAGRPGGVVEFKRW